MSGTPKLPKGKLNVKALLSALAGNDIRSKTATEEFKMGPEFHIIKEPSLPPKKPAIRSKP